MRRQARARALAHARARFPPPPFPSGDPGGLFQRPRAGSSLFAPAEEVGGRVHPVDDHRVHPVDDHRVRLVDDHRVRLVNDHRVHPVDDHRVHPVDRPCPPHCPPRLAARARAQTTRVGGRRTARLVRTALTPTGPQITEFIQSKLVLTTGVRSSQVGRAGARARPPPRGACGPPRDDLLGRRGGGRWRFWALGDRAGSPAPGRASWHRVAWRKRIRAVHERAGNRRTVSSHTLWCQYGGLMRSASGVASRLYTSYQVSYDGSFTFNS